MATGSVSPARVPEQTLDRIPAPGTQSVPALEKALQILQMLATSRSGLSLQEIVQRTGLPRSSVHCILVTLQRQDFLYRNESTSRYMFGLKLFSLANMALSGLRLRDQAAPFLYSLMHQTQLTVHLAILERNEAVLVAKVDAPGIVRLATWLGKRMELHCTGLGKALMCHWDEERIDGVIAEHGLPRHNDNTIASLKRLKQDLSKAAERGYAVDDEEDEIGLRCIGVPVFDHTGSVVAAVSVAGTTSQITGENVNDLAGRVMAAAGALSQVLGYTAK